MPKKKVFIASSIHRWSDPRIYFKLARSLSKEFSVELLARGEENLDKGASIRVRRLPALPRWKRPLLWWIILKEGLKAKADILIFADPELIPVGILWRLITHRPVVYDVHENVPAVILVRPWIPVLLRKPISFMFSLWEKFWARFLTVITATSSIAERFKHATVIYNYPLLSELPEGINRKTYKKPGMFNMVYLGGIYRTRGVIDLVEAVNMLDDIPVHLHLAGSFDTPEYEMEIRQAAGDPEKFTFYGRIPYQDALTLLSEMDLCPVVSYATPNHVVSIPLKAFEALSLGVPVLCSNFPFWKHMVEDAGCGKTITPGNRKEIAATIRWFYEHPLERKEMGKRGKLLVKTEYNWETQKEKLLETIKHAVENKK